MNFDSVAFDATKLEKRAKMLANNCNPYPYSYEGIEKIESILAKADEYEKAEKEFDFSVKTCGRIWSQRGMGKTIFMDLRDFSSKIQLYIGKKSFSPENWENIKNLDLGDIIGVEGTVFKTKTGEMTINVSDVTILSKSVVPIPLGKETDDQVFSRSTDIETKYRERYLHWILDREDRDRMVKRSQIISSVRRQMEGDGFLEVTTPTIEFVYGGAEARPFKTNIWALGHKDAFMRISPELYLKRYIVGGFEKVFTICQNFRNEGIDHSHNPEFTMMEWYEAYTDYTTQMERFENLVANVCQEVCGSMKITYQDHELDFTPPWDRITVVEGLKKYADIDADNMTAEALNVELEKRGLKSPEETAYTWGVAVVELFENIVEEHLIQPTIVMDHPKEISPLTKVKRGDERLVERFEPYAARMEIGNSYSELTDPVDQFERFMNQRAIEGQDYEDNPIDTDFVKALGCGMPPTGGVGIGIERIIMLLTNSANIRDIIAFPMVKPKN